MRGLVILAIFCGGCYSTGNQQIADDKVVAQIVKGKSTKIDVLTLVGKPTAIQFPDNVETWTYVHTVGSFRATNFIPVVGLVAGGMDHQVDTLTVTYTRDGIVENVGHGQMTGGGGGLQDAELGTTRTETPKEKTPEEVQADLSSKSPM